MRCCINQIAARRRTKATPKDSFYCFNFLTQRGWPHRVLCQKVKLCDDGHIAFAQSSLVLETKGRRLQCAKHSP
jgi:hypothetical protein